MGTSGRLGKTGALCWDYGRFLCPFSTRPGKSRCILRKNRPEKYFPGFLCKAEEKGLTPVPFSAIFVLIN